MSDRAIALRDDDGAVLRTTQLENTELRMLVATMSDELRVQVVALEGAMASLMRPAIDWGQQDGAHRDVHGDAWDNGTRDGRHTDSHSDIHADIAGRVSR